MILPAPEIPIGLSEYVFLPDEIFPADLAIVFGMSAWRRPLERALQLYHGGAVKRLLFTGGYNRRIEVVEASEMARAAIAGGVQACDILVEQRSTNTAENVANALRLIETSIGIESVASILLVAIHFHVRRVKMTVERVFPEHIRIPGHRLLPERGLFRERLAPVGGWPTRRLLRAVKIRLYLGEDVSNSARAPANRAMNRPPIAHGEDIKGSDLPDSIAAALARSVEVFADGSFVHWHADGELLRQSYADTWQRARRILGGLQREGVRSGDKLLLYFRDCRNFVPAIWAALLAGVIPTPVARNEWSRHHAHAAPALFERLRTILDSPRRSHRRSRDEGRPERSASTRRAPSRLPRLKSSRRPMSFTLARWTTLPSSS